MKPEFLHLFSGGDAGGPVSKVQCANNTRSLSEHVAMLCDA